jgi:lipopolysaccharide export system protein LptC
MEVDSEPLPLAPLAATLSKREAPDARTARVPAWSRASWSGALPVLGMAALAAATWWLVQHAPRPELVRPAPTAGHVADYEMRGFSVRHHGPGGPSASLLDGDLVRHFADTDTLEVEGLRLHMIDAEGRKTEAVADRAVARADGSELVLEGHARVLRAAVPGGTARADARLEFSSEWMFIDATLQKIRTDRHVTLTYGEDRFEAAGLRYDQTAQDLELDGPVHGQVLMTLPQ